MSPHNAGLQKLSLSWRGGLILIAAFVFAFFATVALFLLYPHLQVNEFDRARLAAENQMLKIENKNLILRIHKLDAQVVRVEERSNQVIALTQID